MRHAIFGAQTGKQTFEMDEDKTKVSRQEW